MAPFSGGIQLWDFVGGRSAAALVGIHTHPVFKVEAALNCEEVSDTFSASLLSISQDACVVWIVTYTGNIVLEKCAVARLVVSISFKVSFMPAITHYSDVIKWCCFVLIFVLRELEVTWRT